MSKAQWHHNEHNQVLSCEEFFVSFSTMTCADSEMKALAHRMLELCNLETWDGTETAVKVRDGEWFILKGDFRTEMEQAFPLGLEAVLAVYARHAAECRSPHSTDNYQPAVH